MGRGARQATVHESDTTEGLTLHFPPFPLLSPHSPHLPTERQLKPWLVGLVTWLRGADHVAEHDLITWQSGTDHVTERC